MAISYTLIDLFELISLRYYKVDCAKSNGGQWPPFTFIKFVAAMALN